MTQLIRRTPHDQQEIAEMEARLTELRAKLQVLHAMGGIPARELEWIALQIEENGRALEIRKRGRAA